MPASSDTHTPDSIRISITRATNGVQFKIFTPMFEQFFSQMSSPSGSNSRPRTVTDPFFGSQTLYAIQPRDQESLSIPGVFYELGSGRLVTPEGAVNLALLTAVGSGEGEGVTFTVRTVLNRTQQRLLTEGLKKAILALYPEFMQPEVNTIEFTVRQLTQ
jgi:hypothetical protein